jgi:hypothetical protein
VSWEIEYTEEFGEWWDGLDEGAQERIRASVLLLSDYGPNLDYPHCSAVSGSRHSHMRELRVQIGGRPFRILHAFNPRRTAILLIGGDKSGNDRWYETFIPIADRLYDQHIEELRREGLWPGNSEN